MKKVSLLIPAYNEEASLPALYAELSRLMDSQSNYEWEILFVNDGSRDNTLQTIKDLRAKDERVCFVDLSRNFGKEKAMLAGFDYATGDAVVVMDADLQHPPSVIPEMLAKWEEGYDDVYARRINRGKESWLRKRLSLAFYALLQRSAKFDMLPNVGDFRLLDRRCINVLRNLRENERYTKGLFAWMGFRKTSVDFEPAERVAGTSSWNMRSLIGLAVEGLVSFSTLPLRLITSLGLIVSLLSFLYAIYIFAKTLIWGDPVAGYPTLMLVMLFLGGVQLLALGTIGEYLGRVFIETKNRPTYVAREYKTRWLINRFKIFLTRIS